ncbi:uncharacterized protein LOC126834128 isoform X2 [Adelges cooleyi]|uniref:uncharacterized protein LOC126834128 isoform X2 n=1 Tax=Adelges cooleyi TaxID=133065 RepID=UPI00218033B3|nr:uncharacterized protein LOC126834128 isoform X2 [Adelges cooleyi]
MHTLRRKTSPFKSDKTGVGAVRFMGDGVTFKAKLIGILEVSEARGDRMCQEALFDLKMAIRAAGEHKQRININIAIDGLKLKDEKTGECLYHHPIHKISFIAQDMVDSRAFGYIFGSPDTGHRFFGIKTEKAASQVVVTMRDLFQTVYELKKQEIERTKKNSSVAGKFYQHISNNDNQKLNREPSSAEKPEIKTSTPNPNFLLNLEHELNNLQQGLSQMESITPPSMDTMSASDPFGDSFIDLPSVALTKLPPPPSTGERRTRNNSANSNGQQEKHWFDKETEKIFSLTNPSEVRQSLQAADFMVNDISNQYNLPKQQDIFDVFTDLDPLGTGRSKPYVDKKDFFQELKNPPKRILNQLAMPENDKNAEQQQPPQQSLPPKTLSNSFSSELSFKDAAGGFVDDSFKTDHFNKSNDSNSMEMEFADFSSFDSLKPTSSPQLQQKSPLMKSDSSSSQNSAQGLLRVTLPPELPQNPYSISTSPKYNLMSKNKSKTRKSPSPEYYKNEEPASPDDDYSIMKMMTLPQRVDIAPEPPPRPSSSLEPPPLPPKKQQIPAKNVKPTRSRNGHYDYIENYVSSYSSTSAQQETEAPPLPLPSRKPKTTDVQKKKDELDSEYYLVPVSVKKTYNDSKSNVSTSLDITLSQLTKTGFSDLADTLKISPTTLSKMTLKELTTRLSELTTNGNVDVRNAPKKTEEDKKEPEKSLYDKYAVFRELLDDEKIVEHTVDKENDKYAALRDIDSVEETFTCEQGLAEVVHPTESTFEQNIIESALERTGSESSINNDIKTEKEVAAIANEAVDDNIIIEDEDVNEEEVVRDNGEEGVANDESTKEERDRGGSFESEKEDFVKPVSEILRAAEETVQPRSIESTHCWATFDVEPDRTVKKVSSPWSADDQEPMPKPKTHIKKITSNRSKYSSSWDDCEESEDNWDTPKRSLESSIEDFSSKNGWSDGESMYEDEPYYDRRQHSRRSNRKISPRRREPSPWDEGNMYSDDWESPYMFPPHWRPPHVDDERRRSKDDKRRIYARPDIDRRIQKMGSLPNWEDEKYQRIMYERRRRYLEDQYNWDRYGPPMPKGYPKSYPRALPPPVIDNSDEEEMKMRYRLPKKNRYSSSTAPRKPRLRSYHRRSEGSDEERNVVQPRKPYSQEELDFSESELEQNWSRRSKTNKWPLKRNQTSPFDDNFAPDSPDSSLFAKTISTCSDLGYLTKPSPSTSSKTAGTANRVPSTRRPKRSDSGQRSADSNSKADSSTAKRSPFEDDFTPPDAVAKGSVTSEFSFKDDDVFTTKGDADVVRAETPPPVDGGMKKSDSINIFSRSADPFEDDDFFKQDVSVQPNLACLEETVSDHETENWNKRPDRTKNE